MRPSNSETEPSLRGGPVAVGHGAARGVVAAVVQPKMRAAAPSTAVHCRRYFGDVR